MMMLDNLNLQQLAAVADWNSAWRNRMRFNLTNALLCVAVFVMAVGCLLGGCSQQSGSAQNRLAGEAALDQVLGKYGLRGKVVLVQFGVVGCANSDAGLKRMIALQKLGPTNLQFLRVEGEGGGLAEYKTAATSYYKAMSPPFPVHYDSQDALGQAVKATAMPCCILVDTFGHIRYRGRFPEDNLGEWVAQLAAEKTDPGSDVPLFGTQTLDVAKLLESTVLPEFSKSTAARSLNSYMGQAGMLVIFVDTHCPFSGEAMRDVPQITPQLANLKIPTVMVNIDDALEDVQKHYTDNAYGVPVLYDTTTATKDKWGIESVPTLVYITADQQVGYNGVAIWQDLATAVEKNLKVAAGTIKFAPKGTGFG